MAMKTATAYFSSSSFLCLFVCFFLSCVSLPSQRENIDEEKLMSFVATKLHRGHFINFCYRTDNHIE